MLLRIDDLDKSQARGIQVKDIVLMFKIGRSGVVDLNLLGCNILNMYFPFNLSAWCKNLSVFEYCNEQPIGLKNIYKGLKNKTKGHDAI